MRGGILAGLCVLNLVAPGLAHAEDRATTDDVRCLVVSLVIAGSGQQGAQAAGMAASLYYIGRLDGRTPDLDLENRMIDEIGAMKPQDIKAEGARCGGLLKSRGQAIQAIGQRITERAAKTVPNPAVPN